MVSPVNIIGSKAARSRSPMVRALSSIRSTTKLEKKDMAKRKPMNYDDVYVAIRALAPNGTVLTKREVATQVAATLSITVNGVERALDRDKEKGDKDRYKNLREGDKFRLPSYTLGSEQTIQDQIKELRDAEIERLKERIQDQGTKSMPAEVKDQMESIFPNGGMR